MFMILAQNDSQFEIFVARAYRIHRLPLKPLQDRQKRHWEENPSVFLSEPIRWCQYACLDLEVLHPDQ